MPDQGQIPHRWCPLQLRIRNPWNNVLFYTYHFAVLVDLLYTTLEILTIINSSSLNIIHLHVLTLIPIIHPVLSFTGMIIAFSPHKIVSLLVPLVKQALFYKLVLRVAAAYIFAEPEERDRYVALFGRMWRRDVPRETGTWVGL